MNRHFSGLILVFVTLALLSPVSLASSQPGPTMTGSEQTAPGADFFVPDRPDAASTPRATASPVPRLPSVSSATADQHARPASLTGWFIVIWSDASSGLNAATSVYFLAQDSGQSIRLALDEQLLQSLGGVLPLNRKRVVVNGQWSRAPALGAQPAILQVQSIHLAAQVPAAQAWSGLPTTSHPWISILCKFADIAAEPQPLTYFQGMYSNAYPGLDHYWRELSYNQINVVGSGAVGWYTLPQPKSYYVYDQNGDGEVELNHWRAAEDCTLAADPDVYFPSYVGINLMFNDNLDCCAWGGGHYMTRDGVSRGWHMTWEPPWGYGNQGIMAHEMGHGFGLPHSSGAYGRTYDNRWDVMSDVWSDCASSSDPVYGCLGQHTISYHKDLLGLISAEGKYTVTSGSWATITLERLALPLTGNYLMAQIPVGGSDHLFYTVEARRKIGYDVKLPGEAVIIHEVDTTRGNPAHVVDVDGNGDTGDAGAMWLPGETYRDAVNGITVTVNSSTTTGLIVTIESATIPLASVGITGPTGGGANVAHAFTANVSPITSTLPITFAWWASGQAPVTHVDGLSDTVMFTWSTAGTYGITVTATNARGTVTGTHVVKIAGPRYVAPGGSDLGNDCTDTSAPCATVQHAVDMAGPDSEVRVAAGTFSGVSARADGVQAVYISKTVTIRGGYTTTNWTQPYPITQPTTLDAGRQGRVLYIAGADISPRIEGLHIMGGNAAGLGGGWGADSGGGVYIVGATATVSGCTILSNTAQAGGGLFISGGNAALHANVIISNAANAGGGLGAWYYTGVLTANTFSGNTAYDSGGGLFPVYSEAVFDANKIISNAAGRSGGGLFLYRSGCRLTNNVVAGNWAGIEGSGLYVYGTSLDAVGTSPRLVHTTLARNTGGDGSGIYVTEGWGPSFSSVALTDTVLVSQAVGITVTQGNTATLEATLWGSGAWANQRDWAGAGNIVTGSVNVWGDPAFISPDTGNYHIGSGSDAIGSGVNAGITVDMDGERRPGGADYDVGADEYYGPALTLVKQAAPGSPLPGWPLIYTIRVTNTGTVNLNATVTDSLPAHVMPGGTLTWARVITAPGGVWVQQIAVAVELGYAGALVNVIRVSTAEGAAGTYTTTVYTPPIAAYSASPLSGTRPLVVTFTDQSLGVISSWLWQFGDGLTSSWPAPTHTYDLTGTHTVSLTVSGPEGSDTETKAQYITVYPPYEVYLPVVVRSP